MVHYGNTNEQVNSPHTPWLMRGKGEVLLRMCAGRVTTLQSIKLAAIRIDRLNNICYQAGMLSSIKPIHPWQ